MTERVLVAQLGGASEVLLAGPAVRAAARNSESLVFLADPASREVAELLPGVDETIVWSAPSQHPPNREAGTVTEFEELTERVRALDVDAALILSPERASRVPLALAFRMAGVPWIGGVTDGHECSLLDLGLGSDKDEPEAERALELAVKAGYSLPPDDDGALAVRNGRSTVPVERRGYVVVHPGSSVPARQPSTACNASIVCELQQRGYRVVVTGGPEDQELTWWVASDAARDLGGTTTWSQLASVLAGASVVIAPNTGPAQLAAAVGTPVVSLFAPVVSLRRWAPYGVRSVILGNQYERCRQSDAEICPIGGHPCMESIDPSEVTEAVKKLTSSGDRDRSTGRTTPTVLRRRRNLGRRTFS